MVWCWRSRADFDIRFEIAFDVPSVLFGNYKIREIVILFFYLDSSYIFFVSNKSNPIPNMHFLKNFIIKSLFFLAYLSEKLNWTLLITNCPASVCPSVCPSVKVLQFRPLLQNHWENFNLTWHKTLLGKENSRLLKLKPTPTFKWR